MGTCSAAMKGIAADAILISAVVCIKSTLTSPRSTQARHLAQPHTHTHTHTHARKHTYLPLEGVMSKILHPIHGEVVHSVAEKVQRESGHSHDTQQGQGLTNRMIPLHVQRSCVPVYMPADATTTKQHVSASHLRRGSLARTHPAGGRRKNPARGPWWLLVWQCLPPLHAAADESTPWYAPGQADVARCTTSVDLRSDHPTRKRLLDVRKMQGKTWGK